MVIFLEKATHLGGLVFPGDGGKELLHLVEQAKSVPRIERPAKDSG